MKLWNIYYNWSCLSPKSLNSYKLPDIFKPVNQAKWYAKKYAKIIAIKKDGKDIPKILTDEINLSRNVSLYFAQRTPRGMAKSKAKEIAKKDKIIVLKKDVEINLVTSTFFW